jgi:hypothetical protein
LALLSGPEPQRTLLEAEILRQALVLADKPSKYQLVIIRGLPGNNGPTPDVSPVHPAPSAEPPPSRITIHDHLPANVLEPLLQAARLVIARPGYSSVMDLERLGKYALLIPTPGQSEQEYLGPWLAAKGWAACVDQHAFSLAKALEMAEKGDGNREPQPEDPGLLAAEIKSVLNAVQAG